MKKKHQEMKTNPEAISLQYKLDRSKETVGAFNVLTKVFTERFLWDGRGGLIQEAFCQKIERRQLGTIRGFHGVLRWSGGGEEGEDELFEFLLLHHEEKVEQYAGLRSFAIQRSISVHLKAWGGGRLSQSAMKIFRTLNEEITQRIPNLLPILLCRQCAKSGNLEGYFPFLEDLTLAGEIGFCSYWYHMTEGSHKSYIHQVL